MYLIQDSNELFSYLNFYNNDKKSTYKWING